MGGLGGGGGAAGRRKLGWSRTTWPGETQVAKDFIAGEKVSIVSIVLDLPNLST